MSRWLALLVGALAACSASPPPPVAVTTGAESPPDALGAEDAPTPGFVLYYEDSTSVVPLLGDHETTGNGYWLLDVRGEPVRWTHDAIPEALWCPCERDDGCAAPTWVRTRFAPGGGLVAIDGGPDARCGCYYGRIAEARGDTEAAIQAYERSLAARPGNAAVRARLDALR